MTLTAQWGAEPASPKSWSKSLLCTLACVLSFCPGITIIQHFIALACSISFYVYDLSKFLQVNLEHGDQDEAEGTVASNAISYRFLQRSIAGTSVGGIIRLCMYEMDYNIREKIKLKMEISRFTTQ